MLVFYNDDVLNTLIVIIHSGNWDDLRDYKEPDFIKGRKD